LHRRTGTQRRDLSPQIILKTSHPIAKGQTQSIYVHPGNPKLLIKIRHHEKLRRAYLRKFGGLIGLNRQYGVYTTWHRELQHYFSVSFRLGFHPPVLQEYHGVIETDLGLGLVVGRVSDRSGNLAPTLADVVSRTGLTDELLTKVRALLRELNDLKISTNDVSVKNIVYGWSASGGDRLVLIEGIGVNTFIPLARFSNYLNIRSNNRHFARTIRSLKKLDSRFIR
jgi:hypothetical protein